MHGKQDKCHNIKYLGHQKLERYLSNGKNTKKHIDKHQNPKAMKEKLYMGATTSQYHKHWDDFCNSMKQSGYTVNGHKPRTIEEARGYMPTYIEELKARPGRNGTMSAWSVRTYFSAAAKVLGVSAADYDLPIRHRADITRSREDVANDRHFSATKNAELVDFASCTGLRNFKELQQVTGSALIDRGNGDYAIGICGKGGRWREAPICGTPEQVEQVVSRMRAAGDNLVWPHVSSAFDAHECRAEYAARIYKANARDIETLPRSERYYCRGNMRGQVYDREALRITSEALGHSRLDVVVSHYLWKLK